MANGWWKGGGRVAASVAQPYHAPMTVTQRSLRVAGVDVRIDEPDGAKPQDTLVFLHGWPDSADLWSATVAALAPRWRCVRFTWPGFGADDPPQERNLRQLTDLLHAMVGACGEGWPVTLVAHDWGCVWGYHYARTRPQHVQRVVGVDVGDAGSPVHRGELGWRAKLGILAYQGWLALAWRVGGERGDRMARGMARRMKVPLKPERIHARMGYPYWATWTGGYKAIKPFDPTVPMLYVFGKRKPFQFQSRAWCQSLAARPGCAVVPFDTGHWVMKDAPQRFQKVLADWLA